MRIELENEFFSHFNVSDREKELLNKFKDFQQYISRTKSLPFFLCSIKDCDGLKKCVDDGFDINTIIDGESLLSIAIANNDDPMLSYLFNNGFTIESNDEYSKYLVLSINKKDKSIFDTLIKRRDSFTISGKDANEIVRQSFSDVYFISEVIKADFHKTDSGSSLINELVSYQVGTEVLAFLLRKRLIKRAKCNQMYVDTLGRCDTGEAINILKILSPVCKNAKDFPPRFGSGIDTDVVKFVLLDKKYTNFDWIAVFFEYNDSYQINKTEVLKFLLSGNFESALLNSISFSVIENHRHIEVETLLEFIDAIDAKCLNVRNEKGYTIIHRILRAPYGNSSEILEKAIAKGYDVNLPFIHTILDDDDEEVVTKIPTLLYFFDRIDFSLINDESSKKIAYLLLCNTALSKPLITSASAFFRNRDNYVDGVELNFFHYINSVFDGHSDCPPFFTENYSEEIKSNHCYNLLPQTARDIFIFP